MIELHLLHQLLTFKKCGTLSKASEELLISQPALSRSMAKLEEQLGVPLFVRGKNKLTLNENGELAASLAEKLLEEERILEERIRLFDRKNHTITLGSCAIAPVAELPSVLSECYPDLTIASEIKDEETLLKGLDNDTYQMIVLTQPLEDAYSQAWEEEHLFITLPPVHPLASYPSLYLKDLAGQSVLLYSQIGFWYDLCMQYKEDIHFLVQNEYDALGELVQQSALPAFTTNLKAAERTRHHNRIEIPILDEKANVTYYCICKKKDKHKYMEFFNKIEKAK